MFTIELDPNKTFFTSDLHLNHFNIAKYCHRPFESRKEMNDALIANWNSVVPEDGVVVCCGDFTLINEENLREYEKLAKKLNGRILLIRGNHDRVPLVIEDNPDSKFIAIVDMAKLVIDGVRIMATHYPLLAYPAEYQIFGHIHTMSDGTVHGTDGPVVNKLNKNQYDVGVDQNNYTPISYWQLCDIFRKRNND